MEHGCPIGDLPFSSFSCAEFLVIGLYFYENSYTFTLAIYGYSSILVI
jgi:hypothetical protein